MLTIITYCNGKEHRSQFTGIHSWDGRVFEIHGYDGHIASAFDYDDAKELFNEIQHEGRA